MKMTKKIYILFILIVCIPATHTQSQIPEQNYYQFIMDLYSKKNPDINKILIIEIHNYLEIYSKSEKCDELLFTLGQIYLFNEKYPESFICNLKIKFLYPESERQKDATLNLVLIMRKRAENVFKNISSELEQLIINKIPFTDYTTAFYDYLSFLYQLKIKDLNNLICKEIDYYLRTNNKHKNRDQLLYWMAQIYEDNEEWYKAITHYQKLIYLNPESPLKVKSLFRIAYVQYKETEEYEQSRDNFIKIVTEFAETDIAPQAQFYLAEIHEKEFDNTQEAVSNYRLLVETYPESQNAVEALKRVAKIKYKEENYEEAITSYYQIYELYPENDFVSDALIEIEEIYRKKLKLYDKAIQILILYSNHFPNNPYTLSVI